MVSRGLWEHRGRRPNSAGSIHSSPQQMWIVFLVRTEFCAECWGRMGECSPPSGSLVGEANAQRRLARFTVWL